MNPLRSMWSKGSNGSKNWDSQMNISHLMATLKSGGATSVGSEEAATLNLCLLSTSVHLSPTATTSLYGKSTFWSFKTNLTMLEPYICSDPTAYSSDLFPKNSHTTGWNLRRETITLEVDKYTFSQRGTNVNCSIYSKPRDIFEAHPNGDPV